MLRLTKWLRTTVLSWSLVFLSQPMMTRIIPHVFVIPSQTQLQSSQRNVDSFYVEALPPFLSNFFSDILNPIFDVLARSTCQYVQSTAINDDEALIDFINCDCSASFSAVNGMSVNAFCALNEAICLDPVEQKFCGTSNIEGDYRRRSNKLRTTACLEIDTGLTIEINGEPPRIPELCLTAQSTVLAQRNIFRIDSCSIRIASQRCQSCTICDTGKDVKFDCGNIQLNAPLGSGTIPGPVLETCVGIGFIFSNRLFNNFIIRPDGSENIIADNTTTTAITTSP